MKAVLISIKPKWCELIASGKKTVEVRKTRPKLETPFKCYIYCTKAKRQDEFMTYSGSFGYLTGPEYTFCNRAKEFDANGKVIGEFVCDDIYYWGYTWLPDMMHIQDMSRLSCVSDDDLLKYSNGAKDKLYGWHISNLIIYDKPKELSEFAAVCKYKNDDDTCQKEKVDCPYQQYDFNQDGRINLVECGKKITKPPQSWCCVEELKGENHV